MERHAAVVDIEGTVSERFQVTTVSWRAARDCGRTRRASRTEPTLLQPVRTLRRGSAASGPLCAPPVCIATGPHRVDACVRMTIRLRHVASSSLFRLRLSSDEQAVDDDLQQRPDGRGGQVALIDNACDSTDESGELE